MERAINTRDGGALGFVQRMRSWRSLQRIALPALLLSCIFAITPDRAAASAIAIAIGTLLAIFLAPPLGRVAAPVYAPVIGACAMVLSSHVVGAATSPITWSVVAHEASAHLAVPALILAFAYLCLSLDHSGFFRFSALQMMRAARGDGRRLLWCLFFGVSLLTFFTSNDIVILAVTPILIHLGLMARISNLTPLLITQFVAANTASMGLYVGNPTNVIIGSAAGLEFVEYARRMLVPTLTAMASAFALVWLLFVVGSRKNRVPLRFGDTLGADAIGLPADDWSPARDMPLKVLAWLGGPRAHGADTATAMAAVSALFALALCAYDALRARGGAEPVVRGLLSRMPVEIIPFLLSFCIIVRGLEDAGLTRLGIETIEQAFRAGPLAGSLATGTLGVLLVNLTNNIPAAILVERSLVGGGPLIGLQERLAALDPAYPRIFVDGALYATNFGANLTFAGALAGLMWLRIVRDAGHGGAGGSALARDFMRYGLLIVPLVTLATCISIAWPHMGAP